MITFPNPADDSHAQCYEASHFSAYKLSVAAVNSFQVTAKTVLSHMTLVDNHYGFAVNIVCPGDYAENEIVINDSYMYGESISPDCPQNGEGGFCHTGSKYGMVIGGSIRAGKTPHNPTTSPRPHHKVKGDACWTGGYTMNGNKFIGFEGKTQMGSDLYAFDLNPYASDFIQMVRATDTEFIDVDDEAFGTFYDPP